MIIVETKRTGETLSGYVTAVTISYFLDWAFLHSFSSEPTFACHREIKNHLKSRGINKAFVAKKNHSDGSFRRVEYSLRRLNEKVEPLT